jgi:hypothetical protein
MIRRRAIHGSAKERDAWHSDYEWQMQRVCDDSEAYLNTLVEWIALLKKDAVIAIVGSFAHAHGLTFFEALYRLFTRGSSYWIGVCTQFGKGRA